MDEKKIGEIAFRVVGDMGGAFAIAQGYIGDRLGLFKAMAGAGPLSSQELADKTGLNERYVREWAKGSVAAEYIDQDPGTGKFIMTDEQAFVLADEDSPMFIAAGFQFTMPSLYRVPQVVEAFKNGGGVTYQELGDEVADAIELFWKPTFTHSLVQKWLPAVPGLTDRLAEGASVIDVGCGHGQSTIHMAKAFPSSTFLGIDNDARSIEKAKRLATANGVSNVEWMAASAEEIPKGKEYDLICSFDCIHDMTNPVGVLKVIRDALSPDGVHLWVEPNGSHEPMENRNPVGKMFANLSPLHCMTVSLAHGGEGLGSIIGEKGARELAEKAGFSNFERLPIDNPFNLFFALSR
jgi:2-polyprenyl-3-methyl-5-hydroxy-6-metoxy-1,4-benzoquinol methylase